MSTASRSKNIAVIHNLVKNPALFSFIQTVRLLERGQMFNNKKLSRNDQTQFPVARFVRPDSEVVRFHSNQKLDFFSSEIASVYNENNKNKHSQWQVCVNMMGLTGSMGVLPYHYTELVLQRLKMKDKALLNFIELFNHRTISLFYQASVKYRLPIEYERKKLNNRLKPEPDNFTQSLLSIIGLGTQYLNNRMHIKDESLIYYSGLFSQQIKNSTSLKQILQQHFNVAVKIKEFVGQWQTLIDDVRTRLISRSLPKGQNACLGRSALIGRKAWFAQDKIRIVLGPLSKQQLPRFAPGTTTLKALNEVVQFYAGLECHYDFVIQVKREDIPKRIILDKHTPPIISWNAWLPHSRANMLRNQNEIVDIVVSSKRLN